MERRLRTPIAGACVSLVFTVRGEERPLPSEHAGYLQPSIDTNQGAGGLPATAKQTRRKIKSARCAESITQTAAVSNAIKPPDPRIRLSLRRRRGRKKRKRKKPAEKRAPIDGGIPRIRAAAEYFSATLHSARWGVGLFSLPDSSIPKSRRTSDTEEPIDGPPGAPGRPVDPFSAADSRAAGNTTLNLYKQPPDDGGQRPSPFPHNAFFSQRKGGGREGGRGTQTTC